MNTKTLRKTAWDALKGRYWWSVLAALVATLFGAVSFGSSTGYLTTQNELPQDIQDVLNNLPDQGKTIFYIFLATVLIIGIAMSIISSAIKLGYSKYNMALFSDEQKPSINLLFSNTSIIWKALWKSILEGIIITLGCVLFVVPGIIFALMFSQSDYILAEDTTLKATEAMKKSCAMMKGNKWKLFKLGFSFFGWYILAGIVPTGILLLAPYTNAAYAAFYLEYKK